MPFFSRGETCPFCFESFQLGNTPFRCMSPGERCAPEVDPERERIWADSSPMGRVLSPVGFSPKEIRCPTCDETSRQRLCPHCHMELPRTMGKFRNLIFAIIGAKEAGKSHYLAVLIEHLQQQVGPSLQILLEPANDLTIRRYRDDFYRPLFQPNGKPQVLRATASARQRASLVRYPLVYTLSILGRNIFGQKKILAVVTLTFFDTAGEDLNDENTMATVNKYIYRSDGLILLLDPLQIPVVRSRLSASVRLPAINTETSEILARTTNLIQRGRDLGPDRRIDTPLAIAFSKLDALAQLIDSHMQIASDSNHLGGFDLRDCQAVDSELQALLASWNCNDLVGQVDGRYSRHGFFALSALGGAPDEKGFLQRILPRRIEDPFLWLLHCHGLLKSRPDRKVQ